MKTFQQFLQERINMVSAVNPARPVHHQYHSLSVQKTFPLMKFNNNKPKSGVVGKK